MKPRMIWWRLCTLVLLTIIGGGLAGPSVASARETINYRLKWLINASTAGDIFALKQGYFAREGLDVDVKAGGPERDAIRELELGYAQFGVASADQVIRAMAKGSSVVVLAQLFQINPLQWIYRTHDFSLKRIRDLAGKTVGITYGGNDETIMRALLAIAHLGKNQVRLASVRFDYTPFLRDKVQVWPVYRNTQGVYLSDKLKAAGEPVAFFDPSAHGVRFVANSVVTSRKMLDQEPKIVRRFLRALLAGWRAAMAPANEDAVIRALAKYDRDTAPAVLRRQLALTRQMVQPDPSVPIGHIDTAAWRQTERIMVQQKLIPGPVNVVSRLRPQLAAR
jgi:NitT/TauT family transport system substrate-binding protein